MDIPEDRSTIPRHAPIGEWYGADGTYFRTIPLNERVPMTQREREVESD